MFDRHGSLRASRRRRRPNVRFELCVFARSSNARSFCIVRAIIPLHCGSPAHVKVINDSLGKVAATMVRAVFIHPMPALAVLVECRPTGIGEPDRRLAAHARANSLAFAFLHLCIPLPKTPKLRNGAISPNAIFCFSLCLPYHSVLAAYCPLLQEHRNLRQRVLRRHRKPFAGSPHLAPYTLR